jgi:hypothetical protein
MGNTYVIRLSAAGESYVEIAADKIIVSNNQMLHCYRGEDLVASFRPEKWDWFIEGSMVDILPIRGTK